MYICYQEPASKPLKPSLSSSHLPHPVRNHHLSLSSPHPNSLPRSHNASAAVRANPIPSHQARSFHKPPIPPQIPIPHDNNSNPLVLTGHGTGGELNTPIPHRPSSVYRLSHEQNGMGLEKGWRRTHMSGRERGEKDREQRDRMTRNRGFSESAHDQRELRDRNHSTYHPLHTAVTPPLLRLRPDPTTSLTESVRTYVPTHPYHHPPPALAPSPLHQHQNGGKLHKKSFQNVIHY